MFHLQLALLKKIFQKNGYPENFIDSCFKLFLNRTHILKEKKPLQLVLSYLVNISLETGTELQKYMKEVLNCHKNHKHWAALKQSTKQIRKVTS